MESDIEVDTKITIWGAFLPSKLDSIFAAGGKLAYKVGERFLNELIRSKKLIIKQVNGIENLRNVDTGAIITCNHFNPFDSFAVEKTFRTSGHEKSKKLYS